MIRKFKWFKHKKTDRQIEILDMEDSKQKKKTNIEEIEILDEDDSPKKEIKKKYHKIKFVTTCFGILAIILLGGYVITDKNIISMSTKKFLNGLGIYTESVQTVEIESNDYDNQGSWHIDKSAKWMGLNTAQVTFDVNSVMKTGDHYKDIVLVLDISESMSGDKMTKAISDSKKLVSYLLSNRQNRIAIVTFDSTSTIISNFSNDKDELLNKLDAITTTGCTNYNAALQNVDVVMNEYIKQSNRDVVTLFLTDGYPNEDTPNQVGTFEVLKDKYPYMTVNGVQYEMGTDIIDEIKQITDSQWVADQSTLNNVLFDASISPNVYEKFIVTDYVHDDYFTIGSVNDIKVSTGTVTLEEELGLQKITWNLGSNAYMTGGNAKMTINLTLKQQYVGSEGYYPTNKKEKIEYKLPEDSEKTINSTETPVLKNNYEVIYDTNTPSDCTLPDIAKEKHFIYQNVTKKNTELSCEGYLFKGWEIDEEDAQDITKVNDDVFVMPEHDVTIRGTWTRQSIVKAMDGTVHEKTTLYKVLQNEAVTGTYAREYTGSHQDSLIEEPSKKIYHWYTQNNTDGTTILNKNNVLFAGHCWQMIRTTDTGGVKMIYNGESENNQCLNTRGTHIGYESLISQNLASNYWYGTDYTYDSVAKTFKVSGTTEQTTWDETTGSGLIGKYTCKSTSVDDSCSTLYLVESYYNTSSAYVIPLNSNSNYSQFGTLQFNASYNSPSYVGYMYNTVYPRNFKIMTSTETILSSSLLLTTYWYAHDAVWGNPTASNYNLDSPYQVSATADYPNLVGEYTFRNSTKNYTNTGVYYIAAVNGSNMYYIQLSNTGNHTLSDFNYTYTYGDSFTDNGDGTYTINNPNIIERKDWYTNYSDVGANKYVCKNAVNDTCSELWYTTETSNTTMTYIKVANNYKYAKGFTWDGNKYVLDNNTSTSFWNVNDSSNQTSLNNAHYTCWNTTGECTTISYIYYISRATSYYINITNGKNIEDAKNEMLYNNDVNQINSTIKSGIDAWYKHYMLNYDNYIEDTIYCNDRSQRNTDTNGWNPNGGSVFDADMKFKEYTETSDLSCMNSTDQFSISNNKAKLTYKVGLMTSSEMNTLGNANAIKTGQYYWLDSPKHFDGYLSGAIGWYVFSFGSRTYSSVDWDKGVRPAISLIPGIEYSDGDGSMSNPYKVELES